MAIDQDILNTLKRMETLMKNQANTAPSAGSTIRAKIAGGKKDTQDKEQGQTFKATAKGLEGVTGAANNLNKTFVGLNRTVLMTRANFVAMNRSMRQSARQQLNAGPAQSGVFSVAPTPKAGSGQGGVPPSINQGMNSFGQGLGKMGGKMGIVATVAAGVAKALWSMKDGLMAAANDAFFFASRGLKASAGFDGLYMDAIKAGMGVREYTQAMNDNMPAVLRAGGMEKFGQQLEASRKQLAGMGIFGEEATRLSMGLANTTTTIGVSQNQLQSAVQGQNTVFAQLRKTTMMTADQFQALTKDLSENAEVQGNMQGLHQQERAARFNEIIQIQTLGLRLGATEKASKALGDALLAQRSASLASRFEAQGLARQAGAVFGMDSGQAERLSMLSRKKNLTADEAAEMQGLAATLNTNIQQAMNSGNANQEFMAEQFMDRLNGTNLGKIMSASGEVDLTQQSGQIKAQEDFGNAAGEFLQGTGQFLSIMNGLSKNPLFMSAASVLGTVVGAAVGAVAAIAVSKLLPPGLAKALSTLGGLPGTLKGLFTNKPPASPGGPGMLSRMGSGIMAGGSKALDMLKAGGSAVANGISSLWNTITKPAEMLTKGVKIIDALKGSVATFFTGITNFVGNVGSKLGTFAGASGKILPMLGNFIKAIPGFGTLASVIFSGVEEAFTGSIDAAFGGDGGWISRIGNTVYGAITSVFGGIADLVDGVVKFFGGDGWDLRNTFDKFAALVRGGFFTALAGIAKAVTFGSDNKISDYFTEAAENSFKVVDELSKDSSKTVASIGDGRKKDLAEVTAKAKDASAAVNDVTKVVSASAGLATTTTGLAGSAVAQARAIAAQQAIPTPQTISQIAQPGANEKDIANAVNSTIQQTQASISGASTSSSASTTDLGTIANILREAVSLLQAGNTINEGHTEVLDALGRMAGRPTSQDSTVLLNRLTTMA